MPEERAFLSGEMVAIIASNTRYPERVFVKAQADTNGKYRGWLKVWDGMRFSGQSQPMISTNAVFKTAKAADAHMHSLVEQIRKAAVLGGAQDL